jgi:SNF2 family DNA or RNA helicase
MNDLNDSSEKISQPKNLDILLMEHQKTAIYAMRRLEETRKLIQKNVTIPYLNIKDETIIYETNIGMLCDKVGAGKTLMISTLINQFDKLELEHCYLLNSHYLSISKKIKELSVKTNLIIIPHSLMTQWKNTFELFKDGCKYLCIVNAKSFKTFLDLDELFKYDAIILSATTIKPFNKYLMINFTTNIYDILWNRIIIDEADSISINKTIYLNGKFIWLITATPQGLYFNKKGIYKNLFGEFNYHLLNNLIVKNRDSFVDESIKLPKLNRFIIKCLTPKEIYALYDLIPNHVIEMINAGNLDDAVKNINCNVDTSDNIFQVLSKQLNDAIENNKLELEYEKKKKIKNPLKLIKHNENISNIEKNIKRNENKLKSLEEKIKKLKDEVCSICLCDYSEKTALLTCCNSIFDFECISSYLCDNAKCPNCGHAINKSMIHIIDETPCKKIETSKIEEKDKIDTLVDIINKKKDKKLLIFANHQSTFTKIKCHINKLSITYDELKGNDEEINEKINQFDKGEINILMLNAKYFGAGLNLHMATDVIIFHRFNYEKEEQVIGRAQRLGRTEPLNVYYLIHDNEEKPHDYCDIIEDYDDIDYENWNVKNNKDIVPDKVFNLKPIEVNNIIDYPLKPYVNKKDIENKDDETYNKDDETDDSNESDYIEEESNDEDDDNESI